MKAFKNICVFLLLIMTSSKSFAVIERYTIQSVKLSTIAGSLPGTKPTYTCYDNKAIPVLPFTGYSASPFVLNTDFKFNYIRNKVKVSIDRTFSRFFTVDKSIRVRVKLDAWDAQNNLIVNGVYVDLDLKFNPAVGSIEEEVAIYQFENAVVVKATVDDIRNFNNVSIASSFTTANYPDVKLDMEIEMDRIYNLNLSTSKSTSFKNSVQPVQPMIASGSQVDCLTDWYNIQWDNIVGAESWELEWQFVEDDYNPSTNSTTIDFRFNSTRVRINSYATTTPTYKIPGGYEKGLLVYRVRPIGRDMNTLEEIFGMWSMDDVTQNFSTIAPFANNTYPVLNYNVKLNWMKNVGFSDNAKLSVVVSYTDGLLKNRQTITLNNEENVPIVSQNLYDFLGRPAISVLPTPVLDGNDKMCFRSKFNKNSNNDAYSYKDFDLTQDPNCPGGLVVKQMNTSSGASKYYSSSGYNTSMSMWQAYTPDAEGYPFIQTEFTPDQSGRIARQGLAGGTHRLSGLNQAGNAINGKESKLLYGKPFQEQLDMMFGADAGNAELYKRNVVIDPNGQASVAYYDPYGKIVASSLVGEPSQAPSLAAIPSSSQYYDIKVTSFNNRQSGQSKIIEHTFGVTNQSLHSFEYTIDARAFSPECTPSGICYDCVYDMELSLLDECGVNLIPSDKRKLMVGNIEPFDLTCNAVSFTLVNAGSTLDILLSPGKYTLKKELKVNLDAMKFYMGQAINNNTCIKSLSEFINEEKENMGIAEQCEYTCMECKADLDELTQRKQQLIAKGNSRTELENQELIELEQSIPKQESLCDQLCMQATPCDVLLELILADVRPGGQYAPTLKYDESTDVLSANLGDLKSILNESNTLINGCSTRNWRYPMNPNLLGSSTDDYYNNDGTLSLIPVDNNYPEILSGKNYYNSNGTIFSGTSASIKYVKPKDLKFVDDFIKFYYENPFWAQSLKYYHPEYCYYAKCKYVEPTYEYNSKLLLEENAAEALKKGYFNPVNNPDLLYNTVGNQNPFAAGEVSGMVVRDPLLSSPLNIGDFRNHLYDYVSTSTVHKSIWELYFDMKNTTAIETTDIECAGDPNWTYLRALYIAAKDDILRDYYKSTSNCSDLDINCPGCSGNSCVGIVDIASGKLRRFPLDDSNLSGDPLDLTNSDYSNIDNGELYIDGQVSAYCEEKCESYKDYWIKQLQQCNLYSNLSGVQKTSLIEDLKSVCIGGCDENNLFGSRNVSPSKLVTIPSGQPTNFHEVLSRYFGPGVWISPGVCDELVLEWPLDYGHDFTAYDGPYADTCACNAKNYAKSNPNCSNIEIPEPLENCACAIKNDELRQSTLMKLEIPNELKCQNCVDCRQINIAYSDFIERYSSTTVQNMSDKQFEDLLVKWMNFKLGFNLLYSDYIEFAGKCKNIAGANDRSVWNDFTTIRWVEKQQVAPNEINLKDSLNRVWYVHNNSNFKTIESQLSNTVKNNYQYLEYYYTSENEGIMEIESIQSLDADKLACHCEKVLTTRWFKDNENSAGLSDVDMMKKMFGSSIYTSQAEFDKNYNVCCNAFKMNVPPDQNCSNSGFKPGDKFSLEQKTYFDNHVLAPNTKPEFIHGGVNDFARMLDNNCNNPMSPENKLEYPDNCACDKLMAAKAAYMSMYPGSYGNNTPPAGIPTFENYIFNQYGVTGSDLVSVTTMCEKSWKSGAGENSSGTPNIWTGIGATWTKVSKENLFQYSSDDAWFVPKGLLCPDPPPSSNPCKSFPPDCYMLKTVLKDFLAQTTLPSGMTFSNPYAPTDPEFDNYNFHKAWSLFYETYMNNKYSSSPDPGFTSFFASFASFANSHTLIKMPCSNNQTYTVDELLQKFKSCLPAPCKPSCSDFSQIFEGFLQEQASISDLPSGLSPTSSLQDFYLGAMSGYYNDHIWNDLVKNFLTKANYLVQKRCPGSNLNVELDFTQIWQLMWYCMPAAKEIDDIIPTPDPKCTNCYAVNYGYLSAFKSFLNQICRGSNTEFSQNYDLLNSDDWKLNKLGVYVTSFYNSILYTGGTSSGTLKYHIDGNTFKVPFMEVKVDDLSGFKFGFTLEFPSNENYYNFGYIKEVVKVSPLGRINCGLPRGFEAIVKIIVPRGYTNKYDIKTIKMTGTFTFGGGYASNINCFDTCVRLCNRPILSDPEPTENLCEKMLLRAAYSNALMKYDEYIEEFNRKFEEDYISHCLGVGENFSMKMSQKEYHFTLYYYDHSGNLIKTVPPEGVDFTYSGLTGAQRTQFIKERIEYTASYRTGVISNPSMARPKMYHTLTSHYKYNTLNMLVWASSPDAGVSKCWYDDFSRLVLSQNSKQSSSNEYNYSFFDVYNRLIETGKKTTTSSISYSIAATPTSLATFMSSGSNSEVTRTMYDNFDASDPVSSMFVGSRPYLRKKVSSSFFYKNTPPVSPAYFGQGCNSAVYYSYDVRGNMDQMVNYCQLLEGLGQQYKHIKYDFDKHRGLVNQVHYQSGKPDQFHHKYTYNSDNSLIRTETSVDNWNYVLDEKLFYYLHGAVARQELGSEEQKVQGVDFAFNINGLLKSINGSSLTSGYDMGKDGDLTLVGNPNKLIARDAMAQYIGYYTNDYMPVGGSGFNFTPTFQTGGMTSAMKNLYNGKISFVQSSIPDLTTYYNNGVYSNSTLGKVYQYDQLYRLVEQKVFNNFSAPTNYWPNSGLTGTGVNYENFGYDAMGNIVSVVRNGNNVSSLTMDNLTYRYGDVNDVNNKITMTSDQTNTVCATVYPKRNNRLYHIDDAISASTYKSDLDDQGTFNSTFTTLNSNNNYSYDASGNLIKDLKEEIASIEYNSNGEINKITRTTGSLKPDLEYLYDVFGQRMVKIVKPRISTGLKPQNEWSTLVYINGPGGNLLSLYELTYDEITASQKYKEKLSLKERQIMGSKRVGVYKDEVLLASKDYTISGYGSDGAFVNKTEVSGTLSTVNLPSLPFVNVLYKGKKQYELNNNIGTVVATVSDRRQAVDQDFNLTIDYYLPDISPVTEYYSYGSGMHDKGTGPNGTKIYVLNSEFNGLGDLGGFTAGTGAITVSNPTNTKLHIESFWTTRPLAKQTVNLVNGRKYKIKVDIAGYSIVSGFTHTVRVKVYLPSNTLTFNLTAGQKLLSFTSNTTGAVVIEISSQITGSGSYTMNPYIDVDSFKLYWETRQYRYAYQGSEYESELMDYSTDYRMLDVRVGRWFSVDPLSSSFPGQSPYCSMDNDPVSNSDVLGLAPEPPDEYEAKRNLAGMTVHEDGSWYITGNPSISSEHLYGYRYDAEDLRIRELILSEGGVLANGLLSAERQGRFNSLKGQGLYGDGFSKAWKETKSMSKAEKQIFAAIGVTVLAGAALPVVVEVAVTTAVSVASSSTVTVAYAYAYNAAVAHGATVVECVTMALGGSTMPTLFVGAIGGNSEEVITFVDEAVKSVDDVVNRGGYAFTQTAKDGDLVFYSTKIGDDVIEFGGDFSYSNGTLTIKNFDIDGALTNKLGIRGIKEIITDFGRQQGVNQVIIQGAKRTTGANPGKIPSQLTFKID